MEDMSSFSAKLVLLMSITDVRTCFRLVIYTMLTRYEFHQTQCIRNNAPPNERLGFDFMLAAVSSSAPTSTATVVESQCA
jgi:hypothetical protein